VTTATGMVAIFVAFLSFLCRHVRKNAVMLFGLIVV
jgi:hypothetical protein